MVQSNISNSIWHNGIITCHIWLVFSCIGSQWARCSIFKYLASAFGSSCSTLKKPSTFPSSTCIGLLWGDHIICAAAVFITCSQQHVVDVLAVVCLGRLLSLLQQQCNRPNPPKPNTCILSCTLLCQSLQELSWQNQRERERSDHG